MLSRDTGALSRFGRRMLVTALGASLLVSTGCNGGFASPAVGDGASPDPGS